MVFIIHANNTVCHTWSFRNDQNLEFRGVIHWFWKKVDGSVVLLFSKQYAIKTRTAGKSQTETFLFFKNTYDAEHITCKHAKHYNCKQTTTKSQIPCHSSKMTKMTSKICLFNFYTTIQDINETIRSLDTATCQVFDIVGNYPEYCL